MSGTGSVQKWINALHTYIQYIVSPYCGAILQCRQGCIYMYVLFYTQERGGIDNVTMATGNVTETPNQFDTDVQLTHASHVSG